MNPITGRIDNSQNRSNVERQTSLAVFGPGSALWQINLP
jgi:hypothetical protein